MGISLDTRRVVNWRCPSDVEDICSRNQFEQNKLYRTLYEPAYFRDAAMRAELAYSYNCELPYDKVLIGFLYYCTRATQVDMSECFGHTLCNITRIATKFRVYVNNPDYRSMGSRSYFNDYRNDDLLERLDIPLGTLCKALKMTHKRYNLWREGKEDLLLDAVEEGYHPPRLVATIAQERYKKCMLREARISKYMIGD